MYLFITVTKPNVLLKIKMSISTLTNSFKSCWKNYLSYDGIKNEIIVIEFLSKIHNIFVATKNELDPEAFSKVAASALQEEDPNTVIVYTLRAVHGYSML